jgi:uncharacterized membrane protein
LSALVHTLHVLLAGVWLGSVVFTTFVVSPALEAMKWSEPERVAARSVIGRQFARVGAANLVLLLLFAVLDGFSRGFGPLLYVEYALLVLVFGFVAVHGAYFGRRLVDLAEAEKRAGSDGEARALAERRRALQRLSLRVSHLNLLISAAVVALAVNA